MPLYSSDNDRLVNKILKIYGDYISGPLAYIFNMSLTSDICPNHLIYSIIKPLFKKVVRSQISNYRPISLLMDFQKSSKS